jgi:hypothetical protein
MYMPTKMLDVQLTDTQDGIDLEATTTPFTFKLGLAALQMPRTSSRSLLPQAARLLEGTSLKNASFRFCMF